MKTSLITKLAGVAVLGFAAQQAEAASFISGSISISAPVTPNNIDLSLATELNVDEANANIVSGTNDGDFASATAITQFVSAISVNPISGLPFQVYELDNGIKFELLALVESFNNADYLALDGAGVFSAPGKDLTFGDFDIVVVRSMSGSFVTFNLATTSAADDGLGPGGVPDAGATSMLLGLGLMGLCGLRRKMK